MAEQKKDLVEARRLIGKLSRTCRQTLVFMQGQSVMDKARMRRTLSDAVRDADRFLSV